MVIGLTGGYCAGKDTVAKAIAAHGFRTIDVDALGHEALSEKAGEVLARFGESVRAADGAVDRRALGRIVFADPKGLADLESIVHPYMVARVKEIVAGEPGDVVINAAILHHMRLDSLCDAVICVLAPLPMRLARAMRRDRLSLREALSRVRSQASVRAQCNDSLVDTYYIRNRGSTRSLERRVSAVLRRMERSPFGERGGHRGRPSESRHA